MSIYMKFSAWIVSLAEAGPLDAADSLPLVRGATGRKTTIGGLTAYVQDQLASVFATTAQGAKADSAVQPTLWASLGNYVDDAAAAAGGVAVGQLYRNGSVVMVRVS